MQRTHRFPPQLLSLSLLRRKWPIHLLSNKDRQRFTGWGLSRLLPLFHSAGNVTVKSSIMIIGDTVECAEDRSRAFGRARARSRRCEKGGRTLRGDGGFVRNGLNNGPSSHRHSSLPARSETSLLIMPHRFRKMNGGGVVSISNDAFRGFHRSRRRV